MQTVQGDIGAVQKVFGSGNLTDLDSVFYLLGNEEEKMTGTVRAKGKCYECGNDFIPIQMNSRTGKKGKILGYVCPDCKVTPRRFYVDLFWKGTRCRVFSDKQGMPLDSYERAKKLQAHIQAEIDSKSFDPSKYVKAEQERFYVSTLLERFYEDKIDSISRKGHYRRYTDLAKEFFRSKDVRELRKIDVSDFKRHLIQNHYKEQPKQGKTLKNVLDHFKTFLIHCMREYEVIDRVPLFPDVELQPYQFKWVGQEDQVNLYQLAEDHDKPFVAFLMLHGCRPGEARALKCKDVNLKQQTITITATFSESETYRERRKGRGARPVVIPIHPEIMEYMTDRVKNNLPEAFIFLNQRGTHYTKDDVYRLWDKMREKAGIGKNLRFYDVTRHSFASQLVNSNTSLYKVSRLLGHSNTKMTEKYAHHDIENLKTDVQKLSLKKEATVTRLSPEQKQVQN